jgi:DNA modification methylase
MSIVFDGSTGVACINTNRNFIGIEMYPVKPKDPDYFGISVNRIEEAFNHHVSLLINFT